VTVRWLQTGVELSVENGGAEAGRAEGGHGSVGMRERAADYGGTFDASPRPGGRFVVRVLLPAEGRRQ